MKKIILGVDGGGTKSQLALFDENGKCINHSICGTLNHECMTGSYEELEVVLPEMILNLLRSSRVSISDITYAVLGIAGADTIWQHEFISSIISKAGIKDFKVYNDAFLGVAAGSPNGTGVCAINGTGTSIAALDYSENAFQIGGMGLFTDDCGGSTWYGEQVIARVYNSLFKMTRPTLLTDMMFEHAGVTDKADFMETIIDKTNNMELFITDFNRFVFTAAEQGDETALDILKCSAEHYAGGISYMINNMDFPIDKPAHIVLAGSVFVKERVTILPELVEKRIRELVGERSIEFNKIDTVPVAGAILWAARRAGIEVDIKTIKEQL
ncbi:MAG: hypothetical protein FWD34_07375 [Oscillospiraceae bacterium]|nr:hypothetical protein [Oscillospiraceae bacterium]